MNTLAHYPENAVKSIAKQLNLTQKEVGDVLSSNNKKLLSDNSEIVSAGNVFLRQEVVRITKLLSADEKGGL